MTGKIILICIAVASIIGSLLWFYFEPGWEPALAVIVAIGGLVGLLRASDESKAGNKVMKQKGGKDSTNYQSGGNMTINNP